MEFHLYLVLYSIYLLLLVLYDLNRMFSMVLIICSYYLYIIDYCTEVYSSVDTWNKTKLFDDNHFIAGLESCPDYWQIIWYCLVIKVDTYLDIFTILFGGQFWLKPNIIWWLCYICLFCVIPIQQEIISNISTQVCLKKDSL